MVEPVADDQQQASGFDPSKPTDVHPSGFDPNKPSDTNKPPPPPPQVWHELAEDLKEGAIGAGKATARTTANLLKVTDWILGGGSAPAGPVLDYIKSKIGEPTGTAQKVGAGLADVATAFVPAGRIGEAAEAADAAVAAGGPAARFAARTITKGAGAAGTAAAQGQDPTTAGVIGGGASAAGEAASAIAPMVKSSSVKTMIRALGPSGGRGPTSEENLRSAEQLAPGLVNEGFGAATQAGARAQAATRLQTAGNDLKSLLASPVASQDFDQPTLLKQLQAKRDALKIDAGNGQPAFLTAEGAKADALYAGLQEDVSKLGSNPTQRAVHDLKKQWNDVANFAAQDPAAGSKEAIYETGGDLVRAIVANDATKISAADQAFSRAAKLDKVLNAANVRRPGAGLAAVVSPYARPVVGATIGAGIGYERGGEPGAVAGAVSGAALGALIQAPGFRYLSAALKNRLADALDKGDSATVSQLVPTLTSMVRSFGGS